MLRLYADQVQQNLLFRYIIINVQRFIISSVFVVGVTNAVDLAELELIASSPSDVLTVTDFMDLESSLESILSLSCLRKEIWPENVSDV